MYLVIGLGNPGQRYHGTRHNVGFATIDAAARELGVKLRQPLFRRVILGRGPNVALAKPLTFMNRSGEALPFLLPWSGVEPSRLVVVCDNLDLPPGSVRLKRGSSSAGHRGVASIIQRLDGAEFWRLFIGIGRPGPGEDVVRHVLGVPGPDEQAKLERAIEHGARAVAHLSRSEPEGLVAFVNDFRAEAE